MPHTGWTQQPLQPDLARRTPHPLCRPRLRLPRWAVTETPPTTPSREGQPAEAWYEAWLALSDYTIVTDPGNDSVAPAIGIDIRNARLLKLRKIRDATPAGDRPMDLLAALIAARELLSGANHLR
ncbi:hypothetical protein AB0E01_44030 [Nocardia vinacea]|uniref:hypothetical protein n=1 Tax=Nocardia vinacea TaxID=96468 RepID=UPI0033D0BDBA